MTDAPTHMTADDKDREQPAPPVFVEIPEGLEELVPEYLSSRKEDVVALRRLLSCSEMDGIRSIAHNLKGNGSAYGFPRLTELGAAIERSVRESDHAALREQISALGDYLNRVQLRP